MTVHSSTSSILISAAEKIRPVLTQVRYKPGWEFSLRGDAGLHCALDIAFPGIESRTLQEMRFGHRFPIPPAAWSWTTEEVADWVFARIVDVERHEAGEFFDVAGDRPFFPPHGYPADPYDVRRR